jgi:hypothetical protein
VVGIFATEGWLIRVVGSVVLLEQHEEEWEVSKGYLLCAGSVAKLERKEVAEQPQLKAG